MLDGRYPSSEFAELRPRIVWDRVAGTIRPRRGARALAVTNAGTIPDRGLFMVTLPDGRRVGELDEEMVYEARPGQTFLLGASSWRIEEIGRDRVVVTPAPGAPGAIPFWKGDCVGRPKELGEAIGRFARWAVDQPAETLARDYDLDELAARNLLDFLREQQQATRVIPSDKTIVIERFRDEIGDWRLCVLSPYGGRIHAAWGLALSARIRDQLGLEADAIWSDDGIIVHLPDADEPPGADIALIEPDELEDMVVAELSGCALFGARFRENAGRSLLIPRAYPGKRTPLWQQRLKSQTLLEVAKRYGEFPIILETYRECLRDVLDLPGLRDLLTQLHRREISVVEVETATASPFASSLLFDYVATYMYEGDTPNAERRAAALSLDRDLLRELLGQEELRDLIDADALDAGRGRPPAPLRAHARGHARRAARRAAARRRPDRARRPRSACTTGSTPTRCWPSWSASGAPCCVRIGGERRWIDAADAGLYRDALGVVPPGGLPEAFLADVPDALVRLMRRYAQTHGPFPTPSRASATGSTRRPRCRSWSAPASSCAASCGRAAAEREWCDADVLRRLRRASLAVLRKEIEPADQRAFAAFLPSVAGRRQASGRRRGRRPPARAARAAAGARADARDVGARGAAAPRRRLLGDVDGRAVRERRAGVGRRGRARAQRAGASRCYFREDAGLIGPPPLRGDPPSDPAHEAVRERLAAGLVLLHRPADRRRPRARGAAGGAVGPRVGRRGDERRVRAAARAAPDARARPARGGRARGRAGRRFSLAPRRRAGAGAGPLVADRAAVRGPGAAGRSRARAAARSPSCCWSATAS